MLEQILLLGASITGVGARKCVLQEIDEIQCLTVYPSTTIKKHGHDNQWEVWIRNSVKIAYVCMKGREHELINQSSHQEVIFAIKGHSDISFDDLVEFLVKCGYSVREGSMTIHW